MIRLMTRTMVTIVRTVLLGFCIVGLACGFGCGGVWIGMESSVAGGECVCGEIWVAIASGIGGGESVCGVILVGLANTFAGRDFVLQGGNVSEEESDWAKADFKNKLYALT